MAGVRTVATALLVTALLATGTAAPCHGTGAAVEAGALANQLAEAETQLTDLSDQVETRLEEANKARVDLRRAERAAGDARMAARTAAAAADAARSELERQYERLDALVAASYRRGRELSGGLNSRNPARPQDVLDRAELLQVFAESERDVLRDLRRARAAGETQRRQAARAFQDAEAQRFAAGRHRVAVEEAKIAAIAARARHQQRIPRLESERNRLVARLAAVRHTEHTPVPSNPTKIPPDTENTAVPVSPVETVIARALSQVGTPYAWGGGDSSGPTRGVRDGGVADDHGDYAKIGFDCSGLVVYAFAGAGLELAHYSGYQYEAGRKVPVSAARRGDLLFWQDSDTRTHHVALYLGNGQMVEAPYSGARVRVAPVRYAGIAPSAVRVL